jgi:hypothetical protein
MEWKFLMTMPVMRLTMTMTKMSMKIYKKYDAHSDNALDGLFASVS